MLFICRYQISNKRDFFFHQIFFLLGGNVPNILHQVTVPIIDNEKCQSMFTKSGHKKIVRESFLCAGYDKGEKDSCEVLQFSLYHPPHFFDKMILDD